MSMTMHEWSELALDMKARRNSILMGSKKAGLMRLSLDIHAELSKEGMKPNICSFNRIIADNSISSPEYIFNHLEINDDSRFQQNMSLFACMEQEPLNLRPNERTFELAMFNLFPKQRMSTMTEALFQLMQTPVYGLTPTRLCWIYRVAAVMTYHVSIAAEQYYKEFVTLFPLERESATLLVKAAINRQSWDLLYKRLLPDIDAMKDKFTLDEVTMMKLLCSNYVNNVEGLPLIRWVLHRGALDRSCRDFFNETLCLRWLSWIATSDLGAGVSDIAEAAMRRLIELRKDGALPRRQLELYLQIMDVETSGVPGEIARMKPDYCKPVSLTAIDLANLIREELRAHEKDQNSLAN
jgi:hypothetical protein